METLLSWKPGRGEWAKPPFGGLISFISFSHSDNNPSSREEERVCRRDIIRRSKLHEVEDEDEVREHGMGQTASLKAGE